MSSGDLLTRLERGGCATAISSRSCCGPIDMSNREPTATAILDRTSDLAPLAWKRARGLLDAGALAEAASFLGTVRPDGRPHSARIGAAWYDGDVYFQTGQQTRKARNLEVNPACTLSVSLTGIDLVFEGLAERITDGTTLEGVAAVWRDGGWAASRRPSHTARRAGSSEPSPARTAAHDELLAARRRARSPQRGFVLAGQPPGYLPSRPGALRASGP